MGGNKVAPPLKAGAHGPQGTGKIYSGKSQNTEVNIGVPTAGEYNKISGGSTAAKYESKIQELKMNNDTLDKEREFYFGKLRDIEEMLQKRGLDQDPLGSEILKILYASEEEHVEVDDKGKLHITQIGSELPIE